MREQKFASFYFERPFIRAAPPPRSQPPQRVLPSGGCLVHCSTTGLYRMSIDFFQPVPASCIHVRPLVVKHQAPARGEFHRQPGSTPPPPHTDPCWQPLAGPFTSLLHIFVADISGTHQSSCRPCKASGSATRTSSPPAPLCITCRGKATTEERSLSGPKSPLRLPCCAISDSSTAWKVR